MISKKVVDAMRRAPVNALSTVTLAPTMGPSVKIDLSDLFANL
jgi:ribosomal protein L1